MNKALLNSILETECLEETIEKLNNNLRQEKENLEKKQEECKHNIVIVAECNPGYSVKARCLFCGKHFHTPHDLREISEHELLEVCFSKRYQGYTGNQIYLDITKSAKKILQQNSSMTYNQLYQNLKKLLE